MTNLIYYSLVCQHPHTQQWIQSVRSIRMHNAEVPIHLFYYDALDPEVEHEAACQNVVLHDQGRYRDSFAKYGKRQAAFAHYRTLHKFRYGWQLPPADQVLYLDCDTYLFGNVDRLFEKYRHAHFFAREEVMTRSSHYGYNREWVDEEMLDAVFAANGCQRTTAINSGVCLMNYGIWQNLADLYEQFLDFAWRLLVGGHTKLEPHFAAVMAHIDDDDRAGAITDYPSSSLWIFEEIALWLTLGRVEGLVQDVLQRCDVIQGGEMDDSMNADVLLAHYWTNGQDKFFTKVPLL